MLDYIINTYRKAKSFHINMFRKYIERENDQQTSEVQVCSVAVLDDSSESMYGDIESLVESPSVSDGGDINDIIINPDMTVVQQTQVRKIISNFSCTFTTRPGCTALIEHDIKLTTNTLVRVQQYPLPFSTMETIKEEIKEMIDLDIVEPSDSPYFSPFLIDKKKDSSNRLCIYLCALNKV